MELVAEGRDVGLVVQVGARARGARGIRRRAAPRGRDAGRCRVISRPADLRGSLADRHAERLGHAGEDASQAANAGAVRVREQEQAADEGDVGWDGG